MPFSTSKTVGEQCARFLSMRIEEDSSSGGQGGRGKKEPVEYMGLEQAGHLTV